MQFKSILAVGALSLSLAACGAADTAETNANQAEPSAYQQTLNATIAACHAGVAETNGWRELDSGGMYEVAKDVVNANNAEARAAAEAEAAEATPMPDSRYVIARCARDMTAYAGGGERPSGLAED